MNESNLSYAVPTSFLGNVILTNNLTNNTSEDGQVVLYADSGTVNTSLSGGTIQSTLAQTNILSIGDNFQLPNNNCIIVVKTTSTGSQGRVILTFPSNVSTGVVYHIIQNTTTDIMLDFNGSTAYISYYNATDNVVGTAVGSRIFSLKSSNVSDNFTSTINIISYNDGENTVWKNLTIAFVANLELLSDDSEATISRNNALVQEYKSTYLTGGFTLKDNTDYKFDQPVDVTFTGDTSLVISETIGGNSVTSFDSNNITTPFYITAAVAGTYVITFHYTSPAGGNTTKTLTINLYNDESTITASKNTIIANGIDFATITATLRDTANNKYIKNITIASDSVEDNLSVTTGNTNVSGVLTSTLTSNGGDHTSTISAYSNTDNYSFPSNLIINFIDQDFFQQRGDVYAWYNYTTYNFDSNTWNDYYMLNNADDSDRFFGDTPILNNAIDGPWVQFTANTIYRFKSGSFPPNSTIFFRAKYLTGSQNVGRIFQGDRSVSPPNQTNYQLGWGDANQAGTFYMGDVGSYFGGGAGQGTQANTGFDTNICTFRTSLNGTYHVFINGVGSYRDGLSTSENKFGTSHNLTVQNSIIPNRIIINGSDCLISDILIYNTNSLSDVDVANITAYMQGLYL
jgi:hypothetical protein